MEIIGFLQEFESLATAGAGGITKKTFEISLGTLGITRNIIIDRMFLFYDQNRDGVIDFDEMVRGMSVLCKGSLDERIKCKKRV